MMKWTSVVTKTLMILILCKLDTSSIQAVDFSGYVRHYTGVLLPGDMAYSSLRNTLNLKLAYGEDQTGFLVNPVAFAERDQDIQFDIRQAYIDLFFESTDLRIGKQQIVWGKSDGVFITDVVSPKNLSDFILPEFEEIRIGVNALKIDHYFSLATLALVWIPSFTPTVQPASDSIWYVTPSSSLPIQTDTSQQEVASKLSNSELFMKVSVMASSFDFEIMGGTMWDDDPTRHTYQILVSGQPTLKVVPEHHRLGMLGGSFSKSLFSTVLRGESAYYTGKYYASTDATLTDGVTQKDMIHSLLGLDFSIRSTDMSLQLINQRILDYDEKIVQDKNDNIATFTARSDFMNELLSLELMVYFHSNDQDSLTRTGVKYKYSDTVNMATGVNIFSGNTGIYGRYDQNDNIYAKITARF